MNKLISLSLLFVCFGGILHAQEGLKEGKRIIGGGINFSTNEATNPNTNFGFGTGNVTTTKTDVFGLSPYYGRVFADYTIIGIQGNFNSQSLESTQRIGASDITNNEDKSTALGGGLFLRRYFPASEKFGAFIEGNINYARLTSENEFLFALAVSDGVVTQTSTASLESKGHRLAVGMDLGLYFFPLPQLSIETRLGNLTIAYEDVEITRSETNAGGNVVVTPLEQEGTSTSFNLDFANQIAFDQLFTINYFF